jgi:hypothetical protein
MNNLCWAVRLYINFIYHLIKNTLVLGNYHWWFLWFLITNQSTEFLVYNHGYQTIFLNVKQSPWSLPILSCTHHFDWDFFGRFFWFKFWWNVTKFSGFRKNLLKICKNSQPPWYYLVHTFVSLFYRKNNVNPLILTLWIQSYVFFFLNWITKIALGLQISIVFIWLYKCSLANKSLCTWLKNRTPGSCHHHADDRTE